jgi:hypothetical protein
MLGIVKGNDEERFNEEVLEFTLRTLVVGEGLDLGVMKFLRDLEVDLGARSRPRTSASSSFFSFFSGESSEYEKLASDLASAEMSVC